MDRLAKGIELARRGAFEEALASFDSAVETWPADPVAWSHRAACRVKLGRLEEAADSLQRGLEAGDAQQAELHRRQGNVLIRLARFAEAQAALARATDLRPDSAEAWYDRGVCLLQMRVEPDAAEAFRRATALDPAHGYAWGNLGVALARGGRLDDAIEAFARALAIDPSDAEIWFEYGVCLGERGRFEDALTAYDRALAIDADDADVWNNRGVALHELGRLDEARAAYDHAIALDPDAIEAAENRVLLDADPDAEPTVVESAVAASPSDSGAIPSTRNSYKQFY